MLLSSIDLYHHPSVYTLAIYPLSLGKTKVKGGELTNTPLFQPSQRRCRRSLLLATHHVNITVPIDASARPPQLDTDDYETDDPEHEADKTAHYDDAGE